MLSIHFERQVAAAFNGFAQIASVASWGIVRLQTGSIGSVVLFMVVAIALILLTVLGKFI